MGVKVREKPKESGIYWIFINHQGKRKSKKIGMNEKQAHEVGGAAKEERRDRQDLTCALAAHRLEEEGDGNVRHRGLSADRATEGEDQQDGHEREHGTGPRVQCAAPASHGEVDDAVADQEATRDGEDPEAERPAFAPQDRQDDPRQEQPQHQPQGASDDADARCGRILGVHGVVLIPGFPAHAYARFTSFVGRSCGT